MSNRLAVNRVFRTFNELMRLARLAANDNCEFLIPVELVILHDNYQNGWFFVTPRLLSQKTEVELAAYEKALLDLISDNFGKV